MQIHVFQSYQGDCLLVEDSSGEHRILCDGGTPQAMEDSIAGQLAAWEKAGKSIDLAYVSHIDSDHIGGIAVLLDLLMQWRVHDFHAEKGDPSKPPDRPRPPQIRAIWHNAFRDLIKDNAGDIEDLLAASAPVLQSSQASSLVALGYEYAQIATSVREALQVSRLIKPQLLNIELNALKSSPQHAGKLLMVRPGQKTETIGKLNVSILCPREPELEDLRDGWDNWLRDEKNRAAARKIRNLYAGALESSTAFAGASNPLDLHEWEGIPAYKGVTVPNVASTVLLVEEEQKTLLLTGDNHPDKILAGLKSAGHLAKGYVHLDVLKYPHHGSEHNISEKFPRQVSADHVIFCGDGSNTNPELSVLEAMFAARLGPPAQRALAPVAEGRPFKFWFSTSPEIQEDSPRRVHMEAVVAWAEKKKKQHSALFDFHFGKDPYTTLTL
jgi:hypothetical protein